MDLTRYLLPVVISLSIYASNAGANDGIWTDQPATAQLKTSTSVQTKHRYLRADITKLREVMHAAPLERTAAIEATIDLPMPDGEMHNFFIEESPVMSAGLAAKYPDFKTYRVRSSSNAAITGRLDLLPTGFHGYLTTDKGVVFIDPDPQAKDYYRSFYKHDYQSAGPREFSCGVNALAQDDVQAQKFASYQQKVAARTENELLTYEIAVGATFEYSQAVAAGVVADTQAAIVTAINRVNNIYERDLAITLVLITNNQNLVSTTQGELSNDDGIALLFETQNYIETTKSILPADYDLGHIFSTGAGGVAGLGVVCNDTATATLLHKSQGVTGLSDPTGDAYYIDYVAHELGHQFGANHTFNGTTSNCGGGNRNDTTAFEPGSGSTIMAYAGICGTEDVQTAAVSPTAFGVSEDTFHSASIEEIVAFTRPAGAGNVCVDTAPVVNPAPTADAGADYTIPGLTPFELTGSDTSGDTGTLTYQWDQRDLGTATNSATFGTDLGDNPLFRSFAPLSSPTRTLPRIETIVSGVDDKAERLPSLARTMNFRLTIRDQLGGVDDDDMQVIVDENSGPFRVFTGATAITLDTMQPQVIEWNAACTELAPVNCTNVDILLSTDSGATFPTTLLAATPNDGEASVTFPNTPSTTAVIKLACSNNIFFDTSDALITLEQGTGDVLVSTGSGGSDSCGTAGTADDGGGTTAISTITPTYDVSNAVPADLNNVITGSVNNLSNNIDVYQVIGTDEVYTIVLSDFGTSDLDMHFTNSEGVTLVQSTSIDTTETIKVTMVADTVYYLVVTAFDTGGTTQSYTITTTKSAKGVATSSDDSSTLSLNVWFLLMLLVYRVVFRFNRAG